jgi:hypothetical protein
MYGWTGVILEKRASHYPFPLIWPIVAAIVNCLLISGDGCKTSGVEKIELFRSREQLAGHGGSAMLRD